MSKSPAALKTVELVCFALLVANATYLAIILVNHDWIVGADGRPLQTDFINVYAAGRLVLAGDPAAAWDWVLHRQAEEAVLGHASPFYYGWHYPPPFLLIAGVLAALPYAAAFLTWMAATLPLYLATLRAIVGDRLGWLAAAAFPVLMPNLVPGQNGFFTASLVGGSLLFLERRPVLAGICLGLLTYKPQFGLLFPLVLAVAGRWTVIAAAAASAAVIAIITLGVFGWAPWAAFFHWLPLTSQALLSGDGTEWYKFQSLFGLVRLLGGSATLAWTLQTLLAVVTAAVLCVLWRSPRVSADMKAAALAAGVLLATPYIYLYDLAILAVSLAFLLRGAIATGFLPGERIGLAAIAALFVVMPVIAVPVGLAATAITAALIARRTLLGPSPQLRG